MPCNFCTSRTGASKPAGRHGGWSTGGAFCFRAFCFGGRRLHSLLSAVLTLCVAAVPAAAQEPTGLQAALAIEQALVDSIASAEKSVVAIARVRLDDRPQEGPVAAPDFPLPPVTTAEPAPTDPSFIPQEYATGVVVGRDGLILTAYHVLGDLKQNEYYVWHQRKPFKVQAVKAADPWMDLAVLQIDASGLEPIELGDADGLRKGQIVVALGNPYAIARNGEVSASWGIVSNLSREAPRVAEYSSAMEGKESLHHYGTLIQTDARLNLGTSGGALVNLKGEMVGLTTSLAALSGYEQAAGYAIPVDGAFKKALENLKAGKQAEYGFLGIGPRPLDEEQRREGLQGAMVAEVLPGTPAEQAGLEAGDVITHINGEQVQNDSTLIRDLSKLPANTSVQLTLLRRSPRSRRDNTLTKTVQLSKKGVTTARPSYSEQPLPNWRGMTIDYATALPQFRENSRLADPRGCVGVLDVERDTPAWHAGLRPGDFVSHVEATRVSNPQQFLDAVANRSGAVKLQLAPAQGANRTRTVPAM